MEYRDYLPDFLREIRDFGGLADGFDPEAEAFRLLCAKAADECFPETAGEEGLSRFERMLSITPKPGSSLEARRVAVTARLRNIPPFSLGWLWDKLAADCGADGFSVREDPQEMQLWVSVSSGTLAAALRPALRESIPAAVELTMSILSREETNARYAAVLQTGGTISWEVE